MRRSRFEARRELFYDCLEPRLAPATLAISDAATIVEGNSGTKVATFTVTLISPQPSKTVTVSYATADGTAVAGSDYVATSGTLSLSNANPTRQVQVSVQGDTLDEADETFRVILSNPKNANIGDGEGMATIQDDDPAPALTVSDASRVEGNSGTSNAVFTVSLSVASGQPVSVNYSTTGVTATTGVDFTAASGSVTFAPGETSKSVSVPVLGDVLGEGNETFTLDLSGAVNATVADGQGIGTIVDDDPAPTLSIADVTQAEGDTGSTVARFQISLSAPSAAPVSVRATTADGTALVGADYAGKDSVVTIPAGSTSGFFDVTIWSDSLFEGDETFVVNLTQPSGATIADAQAVGTIHDDDPQPGLSVADVTLIEGDSGTAGMSFTVLLSAASGAAVTVNYGTVNGTAVAGADYTATSGTLTFAPGDTSKFVVVPVIGDLLDEDTETFTVALSGAAGAAIVDGSGLGTILDNDPLPLLSISDATATEGDTGTVNLVFTVTLAPASGRQVQVAYSTGSGTATPGQDFTATSGTLTFAPGETSKTITVAALGDVLDEVDEFFPISLGNTVNANITDGQGAGTIVDDDPTPTLSIADVTVDEGNIGSKLAGFTIALSAPSGRTVTVNYATADGTATAGSDYTATSGTATLTPGMATYFFSVPITTDTTFEPDETFFVNLSQATGAPIADAQAVGTIRNDDLPTVSVDDATLTEGDAGSAGMSFNVRLQAASGAAVTVNYATVAGTAAAGADYTAASGTLTFAAGETVKTVVVPILGDTLDEDDESFTLTLSGAAGAVIADGSGLGTILDNDPLPTISIDDVTVAEGDTGTQPAAFTIRLSAASGRAVQVSWATADGTAGAGSDYVQGSGFFTIPAGQTTYTLTAQVFGDVLVEPDETFFMNLTSPVSATIADAQGVATIQNDDFQAPPTLSIADATVTEGDTGTVNAAFTVTLSRASTVPVSVFYATADGTATAADYTQVTRAVSLSFAPGETSKTINIAVLGDLLDEPAETFTVTLSNPNGATIADGSGAGTIVDNDPLPFLSIDDLSISEGNAGSKLATMVVRLSSPSGSPVTVTYTTGDGTATAPSDYTAQIGTVTFAVGQLTATLDVPVQGDTAFEPDETFVVDLSNPSGAPISDTRGVVTILNDDPATPPTLSISDATVTEGNTGTVSAVFTVSLSQAAAQAVQVGYSTVAGTAAAGVDYAPVSGTLTFAPGEVTKTIAVPVLGDTLDEFNETFTVVLAGQAGADLGDAQGVGTITDDDPFPVLSVDDITVTEGASGPVQASVTFRLSAPSGKTITAQYTTATTIGSAAATAGSDFTPASGTLTFSPGTTSLVRNVTILPDTIAEPDEIFYVDLTQATEVTFGQSRATVTILDDDARMNLRVSDPAVTELNNGPATLTFTVTLAMANTVPVTVNYATFDSSATAGADYTPTSGTLTFSPGETVKTFDVAVLDDLLDEDDEVVGVLLSGATNATIADPVGAGTIHDNDAPPSVSINDVAGPESGAGVPPFHVTLSAPSGRTVTVDYFTSDGTAVAGADYTPASGTITFAPGQTTQDISSAAIDDAVQEPDEVYYVSLGNPLNVTLGDAQGARTILNDDFNRISGTLYEDQNANGVRDSGEGVLAGRTVYVDLNRDGQPDPGEPSTVTDAAGAYQFSNLPPATYEVRQVLPPGWSSSAPGNLDGFTDNWFSLSNQRDLVYDAKRQLLYATTSDGKIQRYSIATQTLLPAWTVGTSLYGADITPDGQYLYVSEGQWVGTSGIVHKVNLDDGTVTDLSFPSINGYITGSFDVEIGADGMGLIKSAYYRQIDTATDTITPLLNTPGAPNLANINIARGASRSVFLMADTNDDGGLFYTYDAVAHTFGPQGFADALLGSSQVGVNRDGSLLAMEIDGGLSIFDRSFHAVAVLPYDGGFAFDPAGDLLYAIDAPGSVFNNALVAIDTSTWQVVARIPLNENLPASSVFGPGQMAISDDGTQLFLSTTYGVEWFTLPTRGARRVALAGGQQVAGQDFLSYNAAAATLPSLAVDNPSVVEGNVSTQLADLNFTVTLSAPSSRTVTVAYRVAPGSATPDDNDYSTPSSFVGTLTFSPGQTTKTVLLKVRGDTKDELDETFLLELSNSTNATIADPEGVATILNDDTGTRGSISGTAFNDTDRNGFRSAGEAPLAGVTVYLDQNANGQPDSWELSTTSAADGSYSFTNLPGGTYNVAWIVPGGYATTQTQTTMVRGTAVGLVAMPDRRDVVFDPTRNLLYITTAHGAVERYDLATGNLLSPITVGSSLRAADITPDGHYLYVAEGQRGPTQGLIYKIDLTNNSVTPLPYDLTSNEGGAFDLAVGRDGVVLFSATFEGSGFTPIRRIDPVTGAITQVLGSTQDGRVARGADRGFFYLTQGNNSAGTISTFDVDSGLFPKSFSTGDFLSNSAVAVNRTGGLLAIEHGLSSVAVQIYDRNLNLVASPTIGTGGMIFDPSRDILYASDGVNLRAWNSTNWTSQVLGQYDESSGSSQPFGNGEMAITPDGNNLFITTPSGVRIVHIAHDVRQISTFGNVITGIDLGAAQPPAPTISVDDVTTTEGFNASASVFSVTLSGPSAVPVTVDYTTADFPPTAATATASADYTAKTGTLTFAPGETSKTIVIPILFDAIDEPDERFLVKLSNSSGPAFARATGTGTIIDDDPTPGLRITGVTVTEGDSGSTNAVFTVTLLNSAGSGFPVRVNYATADSATSNFKATAGVDYTAVSGTLTFAPGETSKTITVPILGDTIDESNEVFNVVLSSPLNATITGSDGVATGTIIDNDPTPTISISDASLTEGNSGTRSMIFTVTLSGPTSQFVGYSWFTANGTALSGSDYNTVTGGGTFLPGVTSQTISVPILGDTVDEPDETFFVRLSNTSVAITDGEAVGTIVDDDPAPSIRINAATLNEGDTGGAAMLFSVVLSNPSSSTVTVAYTTADGTARAGADYAAKSGTLTFNPGVTQGTISVNVFGDIIDEDDETFSVTLSSPTNATIDVAQATGTVVDNDPLPQLSLSDITVTEGNVGTTSAVFTVTLPAGSGKTVTVSYATGLAGDTATAGSDYTATSGTLTFNPGETSKTVAVPVLGDTQDEPDEFFTLSLTNPANATLVRSQVKGTIVNDDPNHAPALSPIADQAIPPGQDSISVPLSATDPDGDTIGFSAQALSQAYYLDQQLGLTGPDQSFNWGGKQEKWLQDRDGLWLFLLPNGELHRWDGGPATGPLVATLDTAVYTDPSLLYNAQNTPVPVTLTVAGTTLTVDPAAGFTGRFVVTVTASDGHGGTDLKTFTVAVNHPPVLASIPDQTIQASQDTISVPLSATDSDGDTISFSAQAVSQAYYLDQQLGLTGPDQSFNWGGKQEKWLQDRDGLWLFLLPNGELHRWDGGPATGPLVATLDTAVYTDPSLLYNAQNTPVPVTLTVVGTTLTVDPAAGFIGRFVVTVTASDGHGGTDLKTFTVAINRSPVMATIPDQAMPTGQGSISVPLSATDLDGDTVSFSAQALSQAYYLDQQLGLTGPDQSFNWGGKQEKWLQDRDGLWLFLLPNGELHRWDGGPATGPLVATLDTAVYTDPSLLYNAQNTPVPVTLTVVGTTLTVDPAAGFTGRFVVTVTASDGHGGTDLKTFTVAVNHPPVLASIPDQTIQASQDTISVPLSATDSDGDTISFSAQAVSQAYYLDQQLGLTGPDQSFNWGGKQEKWLQDRDGLWLFLLPNGELHRWDGGPATGPLVATLDTAVYTDPSLLYNAQNTPVPVALTVAGTTLTVDPAAGFTGRFVVTVTASDGHGGTELKTFTVIA